jgi:TRAP-type uncharacterized transport system fused permease subunit
MLEYFTNLIPVLFVLAVTYGALELSGVFKNKAVNGIIAIVVSLFTLTTPFILNFISQVLPYAVLLFLGVFLLKFVLSIFKGKKEEKADWTLRIVILGLVFIAVYAFQDQIGRMFGFGVTTNQNMLEIIGIGLVLLIIYLAYKHGEGSQS